MSKRVTKIKADSAQNASDTAIRQRQSKKDEVGQLTERRLCFQNN